MRLHVLAAFTCAYLAAPLKLLDRIRCRWAFLPCSSQRWKRRALLWPDCSTELQHEAKAPRKRSSPTARLLVLAAFACACLAAPAKLPDRTHCRWALLTCSSQRWRHRASIWPDCSTELHALRCHAHSVRSGRAMQGQASSAFSMLSSLLRHARCMKEVSTLLQVVPAVCNGRCFALRNGHYVVCA